MERIKRKAEEIISVYKTAEPDEICEKMDIIILDADLPDSVNGFTVKLRESRFIFINSNLKDYDRRVTVAHELGHIILHGETNTVSLSCNTGFCVSKYEREADCFAAYLLLYAEMSSFDGYESVTTQDISKITHIPQQTIDNIMFD
ncbi:MAG: ImmA/IrrE family metallo-endopeptidase [Acutalibacteraceae bacterium]